MRAILQLRWTGSSSAPLQGTASARVDLNNDGSYEFDSANTMSLDMPVQFGPGALAVRTATSCTMLTALQNGGAFAGGSSSGAITVRLVPDAGASAQIYAPGCGGPPLSARPNFGYGGDLLATGLNSPNVTGLLAVGFAPQSLTLPVSPFCTLDTTIVALMRLAPDASGTAIVPLVVPAGVRPLNFRAQAAAFVAVPPSLVTGPALLVQCQ
ncbi:MAG TPA: hypothetical protein VK348_03655 [Planctomycetota bacterium]|nr:hypothetical protein [Planctomycetota bacterium]